MPLSPAPLLRLGAGAILALSAAGQATESAWRAELTPAQPGSHPPLAPTGLDFKISWKGWTDSGRLRIEFFPPEAKKPGVQVVRSSAFSKGAAVRLFPYTHRFWSESKPSTGLPVFFEATETDAKETVTTTLHYSPSGVKSHEVTVVKKPARTLTEDKNFRFAPVFDLFSAMLHVRSQRLAAGDAIQLVVQPFGSPYLLHVVSHGSETHAGRKAIRLSVSMRKIDRDTLELKPYKKLKRAATLWLSDDADRIPIELRAAVFIGDVRATLIGHERW